MLESLVNKKKEKETPTQVVSCEFWGISKNTFICRTPPVAASSLTKYESQENSPKKGSGGERPKKSGVRCG